MLAASPLSGAYAQQASTATAQISFNIPAQSLGSALTAFADRAGWKLLVPSSLVSGKSSAGVSGALTREQALNRLLAGTGLAYTFNGSDAVTITDPNAGGGQAGASVDGAIALVTIDVERRWRRVRRLYGG
ncbi:STN domain-containing protein [Hyphomicrobium sp. D-2]|uniref:STN domain-containing protein n=1 Tax=Hyphomicrobium sp. D-2 TaxID=3041621 RepID=UPI002458229A|nr:STN domain-containing protein [Hyphomicrobium sp. D-2]MDH4982606.1 STN domain-containing protein [Hyphomicrobium sp. D-2]